MNKEYEEIFASDLSEADQIAKAFHMIIQTIESHANNEIALRKAMNDRETMVKEQIKLSSIQHARGIFNMVYLRATGKRSWNNE
jgi:hypothetical protein